MDYRKIVPKGGFNPGKVAVLCGGSSSERQVSLSSGEAVFNALKRNGCDAYLLDIGKFFVPEMISKPPDQAFISLHGLGGEDGTVQGVLEYLNIPYTGSGVMASAIAMDKYRSKLLWKSVGLATPDFKVIRNQEDLLECRSLFTEFPVFVKPNREGSSIGVCCVKNFVELEQAWKEASKYGDGVVLVEKMISSSEFTVFILHDQVFPVVRIESAHGFYDYRSKYVSRDTRYTVPSGLTESKEKEFQELAWSAFKIIGCSGWGRVDIMQDDSGKGWLLEINTVPGMTETSLVPIAAKEAGLCFEDLVMEILYISYAEIKKSILPQEVFEPN